MLNRKIIHIDMDAFYASVEQRDNPSLRGKPIAVGGGEKRGVTTTASYEARAYGVRSAMPGWQAKSLCPQLIFVPLRFEAYKEASYKIREIFHRYTDVIEPLSLDEAYLDVTHNKIQESIATEVAKKIKMDIYNELDLTASAGVSYCKFLSKIASDMNKPNGLTVIKPHKAISFIESLPVHKFFGVGKVTAEKMKSLGIETGLELKKYSREELIDLFGKSGSFYYDIVRGIDDRPVVSDRIRKSYAVERTLDEDTSDIEVIHDFADTLAMKLNQGIIKNKFKAKTLTLKLKNSEFIIKTRSHTHHSFFTETSEIQELAHLLINQNKLLCKNIRLIGLTLSNFEHEKQEINFMENPNIGQLELDFGTEYF